MTSVASRAYLAALDTEDAREAFGDAVETAAEPPAVTDLLRSLGDTRVWATRETDVLSELDRGDYVLFHRDWGLRCVAQVWSTTADSDAVAAHTDLENPAGEWGIVTLTNAQRALDHVSLLSLDVGDAQRAKSLYRIDPEVATDVESRFTTAARFVEETVPDPLAFDVPPGGTPPDRRPEPERRPDAKGASGGSIPGDADHVLDAHLDGLDGVRTAAWRLLALGAFLLGATLAVVAQYRPPDGDPFYVSTTVAAGVLAVAVGGAAAVGVAVHGVVASRPGLDSFTREHAAASRRAGRAESDSDAATHVARRLEDLCADLDARTRRLGLVVAGATVAVLVGCVYVAYGLTAQVSGAVEPGSALVLAGFPLAVLAATLTIVRRHVGGLVGDRLPGVRGAFSTPDGSVADRLDALKRRVASLPQRLR
ncbi:hypothetical protein [Halobacterium zhouii]|uniref:hypothetical protein n=1 Tax=Halobacterium zhouii TaxID=2902624 RepID=UPI001E408C9E|nr:hypothetical protein [Halobacterium zhouii]